MKHSVNALVAALLLAPFTQIYAAALDRSGQSILPFLQEGNAIEIGYSYLDPQVSGKMQPSFAKGGLVQAANMSTGNVAKSYHFPQASLKLQLNDQWSLGFLYDHPFGAKAGYPTAQYSVYTLQDEHTEAEVETQSLSTIVGYQPSKAWSIYAGPVVQSIKGDVSLRGAGYNWVKYDMNASETTAYGWLAGIAYFIPEIALKAAVTYRSEIDHDMSMAEQISVPTGLTATGPVYGSTLSLTGKSTVTSPQSINIDFQTGVAQNTVAFSSLRWVEWSKFRITPPALYRLTQQTSGQGVDLAAYYDDQFSATVGLGRQLSEKWSSSIAAGWDSGSGNLVTTLGPTEGYWSVGLGLKYAPAPHYDISFGAKYFWLGDAKAQSGFDFGTNKYDATYSDNHAVGYALKLGYKF